MVKENKNEIGEMRIPTDELIKEFQEQFERDLILDFYQEHIANRNG